MPDNEHDFKNKVKVLAALESAESTRECYGYSNSAKFISGGFLCGIPNIENLGSSAGALCVFSKIQLSPTSELHTALLIRENFTALLDRLEVMVSKKDDFFADKNNNCALFAYSDGNVYLFNKAKITFELTAAVIKRLGLGIEPDSLYWAVYGDGVQGESDHTNQLAVLIGDEKLVQVETPNQRTTPSIQSRASGSGSKNIIFFGPPGTGKSHRANELVGSEECIRTLFHPECTYGDFVGTYRPVVGEHLSEKAKDTRGEEIPLPINYFEFVPGPFMQAIAKAISNLNEDEGNPSPVFILIDEINRGDCSSIFGDIFQLLDRDEKGVSQYGISLKTEIERWLKTVVEHGSWDFTELGELYIPNNLFIIGTMNTSDQNLYPMDTAFKRRWEWHSCSVEREYESLQKYCGNPYLETGGMKFDWIKLIKNLNDRITNQHNMEDKQIGPWFIRPKKDGSIDETSFSNKLLFYLWHDVFKDEQDSQASPFSSGEQIRTFGKLQDTFKQGGLKAIFKEEVLEGNPTQSDGGETSGESKPEGNEPA